MGRSTFATLFGLGKGGRDIARQHGADLPEEEQFDVVAETADTAAREAAQKAHDAEIASLSAEREEARKERDAAKVEMHRARAERAQAEAAAFTEGLIAGNKILPGEKEPLVELYVQALLDDGESKASFSSAATSRVEALKAACAARQAHTLTAEQLDPKATFVHPGDPRSAQAKDVNKPTPEGEKPTTERLTHLVELANGKKLEG